MKNIFNAAIVPVLAALAFGCNSTTALQTSEPDDLYYVSSDRTVRQQVSADPSQNVYTEGNTTTEQAASPEYYDPEAASATSVTNNYYYDDDRYYSGRSRRNYMYYNDPFYSPFGYSAAYCYGIYDPFCFPGYYPYSGLTVSIGFGYGWGNPYGYGHGYRPYGAYGYGYRPYDNYGYGYGYGGGYGGYYQGFYDGYYAGGGGYGYGYNRRNVQYGHRGDRSNVPVSSTTPGAGRPASPGRMASDNNAGGVITNPGRAGRTSAPTQSGGQPGAAPGRVGRQGTSNVRPTGQPGRVGTEPSRNNVQPENYQFQNTVPPVIDGGKPVRTRDNVISSPSQPQQERPSYQQERPAQQVVPVQPQRPAREYRQPDRPAQRETRTAPSYNNNSDYSPSRGGGGGGSSSPGRSSGGGRPRN